MSSAKGNWKFRYRRWIVLLLLVIVVVGGLSALRPLARNRGRKQILLGWQKRDVILDLDSRGPAWLRSISTYLATVVGGFSPGLIGITDINGSLTDEDFSRLEEFQEIERLKLHDSRLSEIGLKRIGDCSQLETLSLANIPVTEAGLREVSRLKRLLFLDLERTGIRDGDLAALAELPELISLELNEPGVTNEGLKMIQEWNSLRSLDVRGAKVTQAGVNEFVKTRPDVRLRTGVGIVR